MSRPGAGGPSRRCRRTRPSGGRTSGPVGRTLPWSPSRGAVVGGVRRSEAWPARECHGQDDHPAEDHLLAMHEHRIGESRKRTPCCLSWWGGSFAWQSAWSRRRPAPIVAQVGSKLRSVRAAVVVPRGNLGYRICGTPVSRAAPGWRLVRRGQNRATIAALSLTPMPLRATTFLIPRRRPLRVSGAQRVRVDHALRPRQSDAGAAAVPARRRGARRGGGTRVRRERPAHVEGLHEGRQSGAQDAQGPQALTDAPVAPGHAVGWSPGCRRH
jgi:hypothetical protein